MDGMVEVPRAKIKVQNITDPGGRRGGMTLARRSCGNELAEPGDYAEASEAIARELGGGFWKKFRNPSWLMRGSRLRCALRLWFGGRILGDQAMFIRREALERIGGVPDVPLMEDIELSRRLRPLGRLVLADATVSTSTRRFRKLGVLRTYVRMAHVTLRHRLGATPEELRRLYEKE